MKHEWRKHEKDLYGAKKTPRLITIPKQKYITITGKGNPNDIDFSNRVSALYALAYAVKAEYKTAAINDGFFGKICDFTVYPLEGIWKLKEDAEFLKENLEYTIMVRQPDFIGEDMVKSALEKVKVKKPMPLLDEIGFHCMQDGKCVEILHIGSYDDEPVSFAEMDKFMETTGLKRASTCHREIYLNNAQRVETSKLKTILRYFVK